MKNIPKDASYNYNAQIVVHKATQLQLCEK